MLDRNDKAWIVETIDEKLNGAKEELREEMRGMEDRISDRVAERVTADVTEKVTAAVTEKVTADVTEKVTAAVTEKVTAAVTEKVTADVTEKVTDRVTTNVMTVFENTYGEYIKLIAELVPDKARSYDRIDEKQSRQQEDIEMLKIITKNQEKRICTLEEAMA